MCRYPKTIISKHADREFIMNTKEYLNRYREVNAEIDSLCEELAHWRNIAMRVTPPDKFEGSKSTTPSDKVGHAVAMIIDLESKINAKIDELINIREAVKEKISFVDNAQLRQILTLRYINLKQWEDIAEYLHKDLRWVYRLHGRALEKIRLTIESHL